MILFFSESLSPHEKVHSENSGVILHGENKVSELSEGIHSCESKSTLDRREKKDCPKSAIYRKRRKEISKNAKFLILIINTLRPLR